MIRSRGALRRPARHPPPSPLCSSAQSYAAQDSGVLAPPRVCLNETGPAGTFCVMAAVSTKHVASRRSSYHIPPAAPSAYMNSKSMNISDLILYKPSVASSFAPPRRKKKEAHLVLSSYGSRDTT